MYHGIPFYSEFNFPLHDETTRDAHEIALYFSRKHVDEALSIINSTDEENVKHLVYMNVFCPSNTSQEKKSYCSPSLGQVDT